MNYDLLYAKVLNKRKAMDYWLEVVDLNPVQTNYTSAWSKMFYRETTMSCLCGLLHPCLLTKFIHVVFEKNTVLNDLHVLYMLWVK